MAEIVSRDMYSGEARDSGRLVAGSRSSQRADHRRVCSRKLWHAPQQQPRRAREDADAGAALFFFIVSSRLLGISGLVVFGTYCCAPKGLITADKISRRRCPALHVGMLAYGQVRTSKAGVRVWKQAGAQGRPHTRLPRGGGCLPHPQAPIPAGAAATAVAGRWRAARSLYWYAARDENGRHGDKTGYDVHSTIHLLYSRLAPVLASGSCPGRQTRHVAANVVSGTVAGVTAPEPILD